MKITSGLSHCHNSVMNKTVTNFKSANGKGCVLWPCESGEVGFAKLARLVEWVRYSMRVSRQPTRTTFPQPREQNKGNQIEEIAGLRVFSIVSLFVASMTRSCTKVRTTKGEGGVGHSGSCLLQTVPLREGIPAPCPSPGCLLTYQPIPCR